MPPSFQPNLTRRQMLRRTAAGLLAVGLGSRTLSASTQPPTFRFVVINDIHSRDHRCLPWLRKLAASIHSHNPDFILLNGDISDNGLPAQLAAVRDTFATLRIPIYATLGNHDYTSDTDHTPFNTAFPNSINYHFQHNGWQFLGLDSTQRRDVFLTHIQPRTLAWLDATLPTLDPARPTVICTHFPLGDGVLCRPINAGDLLARFAHFNLRATFSGHWHGYAERHFDLASVTNSRCASWWRANMDGSKEKGYFLCQPTPAATIHHQFCVVT
jgi:3',5'-cyclic AMP phosphodiesterase CpdA